MDIFHEIFMRPLQTGRRELKEWDQKRIGNFGIELVRRKSRRIRLKADTESHIV